MYGGTLDVEDLAALGYTTVGVLGFFSAPNDANHVVIEPPLGGAADNLTVSYNNGTSIDDQATLTQYTIVSLVTRDDVRIKLNGGGSETVDDLGSLGPYNLIFDGSNRSAGANTLKVSLVTPGFLARMSTDADGDPQLKVIGGLLSFHGSGLADRINVDDDVPANAPIGLTNTFDIDDSALQGTLDLVGIAFATAHEGDAFDVTNTPMATLTTELTGGAGANVFEITHGGVNENISIVGGTGNNTLVLDRPLSSATDPDSVKLTPFVGRGSSKQVEITGSATSITMSGVYDINVNMYGGTLDAGDLSQIGAFAIGVTGQLSPLNDPNHVIIEPPLAVPPTTSRSRPTRVF